MAICGFMGTGKTTVGRHVAARLGLAFVDLDDVIASRHGPIAAQLKEDEARFRRRESDVLADVLAGPPVVLATGGGTVVDDANRDALAHRAFTVSLHAPLDALSNRPGVRDRPLWERAPALLAARREAYADADLHVDATEPPEVVSERIAAAARRGLMRVRGAQPVVVDTAPPGHDAAFATSVHVGTRLFGATDRNVERHWGGAATAFVRPADWVVIPAGERHKHVGTWRRLVGSWLDAGLDRGSAALAVGGGTVSDVAGFAAATALRGIPWVAWPTTLLAMVDAAIGGKTGVNARGGKNRVGAFHSARLVWASLATLSTLPQRAARAGLAEVVKVALVADAPLFALVEEQAEQLAALDPESLGLVVAGAARAKLAVVARDPLERGERVCLNAGHTVGHAIEAVSGFRVPHGEAVARGLVAELRWGEGRGVTRTGLADRVERVLRRLRLPVHVRVRPGLVDALALDKKASADRLVVPVPTDVGCWEPVPLAWAEAGTLVASR